MTFDEAIQELRWLSMDGTQKLYSDDAIQLINELKQEYAPTILLTPNQYKELKAGNTLEEKIARISRLAHNSSDDSLDVYINDDMIMRSYLFPETIKVVDN